MDRVFKKASDLNFFCLLSEMEASELTFLLTFSFLLTFRNEGFSANIFIDFQKRLLQRPIRAQTKTYTVTNCANL